MKKCGQKFLMLIEKIPDSSYKTNAENCRVDSSPHFLLFKSDAVSTPAPSAGPPVSQRGAASRTAGRALPGPCVRGRGTASPPSGKTPALSVTIVAQKEPAFHVYSGRIARGLTGSPH